MATQGPLAETTEDLWRMLWEHNSTIVVMLTKLWEMGRVGDAYMYHRQKNDKQHNTKTFIHKYTYTVQTHTFEIKLKRLDLNANTLMYTLVCIIPAS